MEQLLQCQAPWYVINEIFELTLQLLVKSRRGATQQETGEAQRNLET
jgi:hypothetical protein